MLGLALLTAGSGIGYASALPHGLAVSPAAASGVPRLGAPSVTHEPDTYQLLGVSCSSVRNCMAVGWGEGPSVDGGVAVPITSGLAGKPVINTDRSSIFYAVRCISASECVIAGEGTPKGASSIQGEVWLLRSGKLSLVKQPASIANVSSNFRGVACSSAKTCVVVGDAIYESKSFGQQPTSVMGRVSLTGTPSLKVFDAGALAYAAAVSCPSTKLCYVGGATDAEAGAVAKLGLSRNTVTGPYTQPSVSGLEALTCPAVSSCAAAEVQYLTYPESAGKVEHLNSRAKGTPSAVTGAQLMFGIAEVNPSYYLAVGSTSSDGWLTDLVTATGRALTPGLPAYDGYLQAVTCPVQTECIAVGFAPDSATSQPGGLDGVDGAIAVLRLTTAPSAPKLSVRSATRSTVTLRLAPPSSDGGAAVTSYQVSVSRCEPHHSGCRLESVKTVRAGGTKRSVRVTGLASGTTYYFEARAVNAIGAGPYSGRVHSKG